MFASTENKGFNITFENGYSASVQFGKGNYCNNLYAEYTYEEERKKQINRSKNAEVACYDTNTNEWYDLGTNGVLGYQSPAEVLELLNMISKLPSSVKAETEDA